MVVVHCGENQTALRGMAKFSKNSKLRFWHKACLTDLRKITVAVPRRYCVPNFGDHDMPTKHQQRIDWLTRDALRLQAEGYCVGDQTPEQFEANLREYYASCSRSAVMEDYKIAREVNEWLYA